MARRMPTLKARDVIKVLNKLGFKQIRQSGSHICLAHFDGRFTLVPKHGGEDIGRGLLRKIMKEIDVAPEQFSKYL